MDPKMFDMNSIFSVAQQIAKDIKNSNPELNKDSDASQFDMSNIIQQVTKSVSNVVTPEFIENISDNKKGSTNLKHKHKKNKSITNSNAKTDDIDFDLPVTLYDVYYGKTKKLNVKVNRIIKDKENVKVVNEKIKLHVEIEKGVVDGTVIKFEGQGDQKPGFKPGDINITIRIEEDETYERDENNLIYHHFCSLSDCYNLDFILTHPNGNNYRVISNTKTFNFTNPVKIIKGMGMPIRIQDTDSSSGNEPDSEYGDLYILLHFALPYELTEEQIISLKTVFPPMEKDDTNNKEDTVENEPVETLEANDPDNEEETDDEEEETDDEDLGGYINDNDTNSDDDKLDPIQEVEKNEDHEH